MARKKRRWKWLIVLLVIAALAAGGYWYWNNRKGAAGPDISSAIHTSPVVRGNISAIVSGSGSVATSREQSLAAPGASTLLQINVEDGEYVSKGDVLFVLDCPEVVSSQQAVSKYEYQLAEYYAARDELQRVADKDYLVTSLGAKIGDKLMKNGNLMSLLDISIMSIQVPAADGAAWASGQILQVTLLEYGNTIYGTLSGDPTASSNNGMDYLTFTLILDKGQRIGGETYGQAYNRNLNNQAAVMLKPNAETQIKSPADGYLEVLNAVEGEIISEGTLMFRISSTNLDSQISDANSEMQVAMSNLKQKQTVLTADFDGIYYAAADSSGPKNTFLQIGDSMRSGESLGKIVDSDRMQIVFNVDELDIAKVEIGQEVNVIADALPDKVYTGRVARIAQEGASSGNVAYYWVLIEVTEWEGLKVGMTSSLEIVVEESFDTLMVPINAVHTLRGIKYVILAEDQTGADGGTTVQPGRMPNQSGQRIQGGQPEGAQEGQPQQRTQNGAGNVNIQLPERAIIVETGVVNDTFVEILSGLEEGQVVEVAGTRANNNMNQGFMMIPGMGGGNISGPGPGATMTVTRID